MQAACIFRRTRLAATTRAVASCAAARSRAAGGVRAMAFLSSKNEQLCGLARKYVETWGAAGKDMQAAKQELQAMVAPDAVFKADGLVYRHDTKGLPSILQALEREHAAYEHTTYQPVAVAADDAASLAFVGVAWECRGRSDPECVCRGFSIKRLQFDGDGKLVMSRVNRQLTKEEQQRLLAPGTTCQPADIFGDVLPKLGVGAQVASEQRVNDAAYASKMASAVETWVSCWSSKDKGDLDARLHTVLAPGVLAYDACGLQAAADKPGREGHAVSMMGREDAAGVIKRLHAKFDDSNTLVASAVNPDMRVAFDHWRGEAEGRGDSDAKFVVEGVDMLLFDEEGKITTLVQFNMQDYSRQLRDSAPAGGH